MIPQCTDDYHVFGVGIEKIRTVWIEHDPENYGYYEGISGGELYALCECTIASFILKSDTDDVVSVIWDCHRAIHYYNRFGNPNYVGFGKAKIGSYIRTLVKAWQIRRKRGVLGFSSYTADNDGVSHKPPRS